MSRGNRDKRAFYIYCPNEPIEQLFPFNSDVNILNLNGLPDVDLTGSSLGNQDVAAGWAYVCIVDATFSGGSNTSDTSNRCQPNAETIENTTFDISGTINLKAGSENRLVKLLACKYDECTPFFTLMTNCPRTETDPVYGWWVWGSLKSWNESQPLNGQTQITFNITPEPSPEGGINRGKVSNRTFVGDRIDTLLG